MRSAADYSSGILMIVIAWFSAKKAREIGSAETRHSCTVVSSP
jgi:hypothetical protein